MQGSESEEGKPTARANSAASGVETSTHAASRRKKGDSLYAAPTQARVELRTKLLNKNLPIKLREKNGKRQNVVLVGTCGRE